MREITIPSLVEAPQNSNATDLIEDHFADDPDLALFARQTAPGEWTDISVSEFRNDVQTLARALAAMGIERGQSVAIMSPTRYEWTLLDLAILYAGAVTVPIYETSSPSQIAWILEDSDVQAAVVETEEHKRAVQTAIQREGLAELRGIWVMDNGLDDLRAQAEIGPDAEAMNTRRSAANLDDVATIVYTSGTTGRPKGCMITHGNLVNLSLNVLASEMGSILPRGSKTIMFIPLAHIFARFISFQAIAAGAKVGHTPDVKDLVPDLKSYQPDFILAVPRVFEKVYNSAMLNAEQGGKGKIFHTGANIAIEYSKAKEAGSIPVGLRLKHWVFDKLLYTKIRAAMGGNVTDAISGGGPLGAHLSHFFRGVGVDIKEGYGLTETTAPVTVNRPGDRTRVGTVGLPVPGNSIRIAEDGEILAQGISVFKGYHNLPDKTAEEIVDGWFHTGDIGQLDDDGFLSITGRKKEILVTASGKNIAPAQLEDQIRADGLISQVMVVGDNQKFVAAIITLDSETAPSWLQQRQLDEAMTMAEMAQHPVVREHVQGLIDQANESVSRAESIREFRITDQDFTIESGQMTPSLKIRRETIMRDYADLIDDIYQPTAS
ncbi:MAG TPA: AMP-dependent synthetase/ligase [Candidatus Yaniella excrementavium]|nr:AMP-dependent synthetase/ligase [Candidatus Yaniella excrementavium]